MLLLLYLYCRCHCCWHKHLVLVCPQALDAVTQISQPDSFAGKVPKVKVAVGTVVVATPPD